MSESRSTMGRIVTWIVVGLLVILAVKVLIRLVGFLVGLVGLALGILMTLVFTLGPLVLVGWLAIKAWRAFTKEPAV